MLLIEPDYYEIAFVVTWFHLWWRQAKRGMRGATVYCLQCTCKQLQQLLKRIGFRIIKESHPFFNISMQQYAVIYTLYK